MLATGEFRIFDKYYIVTVCMAILLASVFTWSESGAVHFEVWPIANVALALHIVLIAQLFLLALAASLLMAITFGFIRREISVKPYRLLVGMVALAHLCANAGILWSLYDLRRAARESRLEFGVSMPRDIALSRVSDALKEVGCSFRLRSGAGQQTMEVYPALNEHMRKRVAEALSSIGVAAH